MSTSILVRRKQRGVVKRRRCVVPCQVSKVLVMEAIRRFQSSYVHELHHIECEMEGGALILLGSVSSYHLKQLAQEAVRGLVGVTRVHNRLAVFYGRVGSEDPYSFLGDNQMNNQVKSVFHCTQCGRIEHRLGDSDVPYCCDRAMYLACQEMVTGVGDEEVDSGAIMFKGSANERAETLYHPDPV